MDTILIKLSGEIFPEHVQKIVAQIKKLSPKYKLGLVVGAGNLFRGRQQCKKLGLTPTIAHTAGMVATIINGLVLQDLLIKSGIDAILFSAIECPQVANSIQQNKIDNALKENKCIIFAGGTGNPFFSTDTNAILKALQIGTTQVWKGTKVAGVYSDDPEKNKKCKLYKKISYKDFIEQNLKVMDLTAITLAQQNKIKIRVFDLFEKDALLKAEKDSNFGSCIS